MPSDGTDFPTSLDELIPNARACVERLRRQYGHPADFDFRIREMLETALRDQGFDRRIVAAVKRVIFDTK